MGKLIVRPGSVTYSRRKKATSEQKSNVHKAKWHTKVAPLYGNITLLCWYEEFWIECLVCGKQFIASSKKHVKEEHDLIDEEVKKYV